MPVFNCFYKIVKKNITSILIYTVVFIAVFILFANTSNSDIDGRFSNTPIPMAVVDRDQSSLSKALADYLGERHELVDLPDDTEALQDALFFRDIEYILWIPDGFEETFLSKSTNLLLENTKLPGSTSGIYIDNQIDRYLATINAYLNAEFKLADALINTSEDLALTTAVELNTGEPRGVSMIAAYFQYLPYVLIAIVISALGPVLMVFNQRDISKRMEASSLTLRERNIQIALGCIVISLVLWGIFMAAMVALNSNDIFTLTSALRVLNSLIFLIVSMGIAFLLGQFLKTTESLTFMTNCISLGMSFLCGIFISQELLGSGILSIAKFLPAYWYIRNNDILTDITSLNTANIQPYLQGILVQLGFAAALLIVALVISRQKKFHPVV